MSSVPTAVLIGGGFYGCMIAVSLRQRYARVVLLEHEPELLRRASFHNQARVHGGYHYPRSLVTALRSRVNFDRFVREFRECISNDFEKYYAVGREASKVTGKYFETFCRRIGAPIERAPRSIQKLFSPELVDGVFVVQEYAFDAVRLRDRCRGMLDDAGVDVRLNAEVVRLDGDSDGSVRVDFRTNQIDESIIAAEVFNCTYSQLNQPLASSGLPLVPLKHELTEMALVEVPDEFRDKAVTMMCGPFFSCMPFPSRGLHTLSHVRYTPHRAWHDAPNSFSDPRRVLESDARRSNFPYMIRDAQRYLPLMAGCRHVDSLWGVKTILPASEVSDSRPILFKKHWGLPNLHCIVGSKIDNVFDVLDEIESLYTARRCA
jgi:glycine/D-amino acid oxidase-like deaminating enzyme